MRSQTVVSAAPAQYTTEIASERAWIAAASGPPLQLFSTTQPPRAIAWQTSAAQAAGGGCCSKASLHAAVPAEDEHVKPKVRLALHQLGGELRPALEAERPRLEARRRAGRAREAVLLLVQRLVHALAWPRTARSVACMPPLFHQG
jgi:hypothetical protein